MNLTESVTLEDFKNLSEALNYYKCRDIDKALFNIRKVLPKIDDPKSKTKSFDQMKQRSKIEDFKNHIQVICNKLKLLLENGDIGDSWIKLYNYALLLFIMQQDQQCNKILDRIVDSSQIVDSQMLRQYKLLRIDNHISLQMFTQVIKVIDEEMKQEEDTQKYDMGKSDYLAFLFTAQLMLKQYQNCVSTLESLKHMSFPLLNIYQAHYFYYQRNIGSALECITRTDNVTEKDHVYTWNALGCLHFHLAKFNIAILYFNRSINVLEISQKKPKLSAGIGASKLSMFGKSYEFMHNLGLAMLFADRPVEAFDLLLEVVKAFPQNPRLWLRLVECCIKAFKIDESKSERKTYGVEKIIGQGSFKFAILEAPVKKCKWPIEEVAAMPTPSLEFGSLCVKNALSLLPGRTGIVENGSADDVIKWYKDQHMFVQPAGFIQGLEILYLENSLLLNGAFIALSLNNYVETVQFSDQLLTKQPLVSPLYRYQARMYMAEARVMMNNYSDINLYLNPNLESVSLIPTPKAEENVLSYTEQDRPHLLLINNTIKLEEATSNVYFNLAVVWALRSHPKNVETYLKGVLKLQPPTSGFICSSHYLYLRLHLELSRGHVKNCLSILSELCHQIPLPRFIEAPIAPELSSAAVPAVTHR